MNEDCDDLREQLREHEEKSFKLFKEVEKLHQESLRIPAAKRNNEISNAFAKQKEAIEEIHITAEIQRQIDDGHCDEAENQLPEPQED